MTCTTPVHGQRDGRSARQAQHAERAQRHGEALQPPYIQEGRRGVGSVGHRGWRGRQRHGEHAASDCTSERNRVRTSTPVGAEGRRGYMFHAAPADDVAASQEDERNVGTTRRTSGEEASAHDRRRTVGDADAAAGHTGGVGGGVRGHRWRSPRHRSRSAARRRLPQRATLAQRGRRSTTRRHWSRGETAGRTDVTAGGVSGNGGIPYRATTPIQQAFPQRWANGFESKAVGLPSAS